MDSKSNSRESDSELHSCASPHSQEVETNDTALRTLPLQSQEKYMAIYRSFLTWMESKQTVSFSESVLMAYFVELSEKRKPSTLWAQYSMLKATIKVNNDINIGKYTNLLNFIKKQSIGFTSTKTKSLSFKDIQKFIIEAPDLEYLAVKVALIFGINGGCKNQELINVTVDNVEHHGQILLVRVPTKSSDIPRSFAIEGEFYSIVKKYIALRPKRAISNRFFLNYQRGRCTTQVIGKNKFNGMPKQVARYLNLPDANSYTGRSSRRKSNKLQMNEKADLKTIKHHVEIEEERIDNVLTYNEITMSYPSFPEDPESDPLSYSSLPEDPESDPTPSEPPEPNDKPEFTISEQDVNVIIQSEHHNSTKHEQKSSTQKENPTTRKYGQLNQSIITIPEMNRTIHFTNCTNITINLYNR